MIPSTGAPRAAPADQLALVPTGDGALPALHCSLLPPGWALEAPDIRPIWYPNLTSSPLPQPHRTQGPYTLSAVQPQGRWSSSRLSAGSHSAVMPHLPCLGAQHLTARGLLREATPLRT